MAMQSSGEIDWKSYEKEVDPEVLKMFKDSFACELPHIAYDSGFDNLLIACER